MDRSRNALLFVSWVLVFAVLIADAFANYVNLNALIENEALVANTHQVKERLGALLTNCVDAESGVRGYVITGDKDFLRPFDEAETRIAGEYRVLNDLLTDNPPQQMALGDLHRLRDRHREVLMEAASAVDAKVRDAGGDVVKTGRGKSLMDQMRARIATMLANEDRLLDERARHAKDRYHQALVIGFVGTLLSVAIAGIALLVVWRELGWRRAAQAALKVQVEETRLNAERFRLLTETAPIHIWIAQVADNMIFPNRNWQQFTGLMGEAIGLGDWLTTIHPEDADRLRAIWARPDGGSQNLYLDEVRVRRAVDQSYRWHRCAVVPVRTRGGVLQSWVGTLADIQDQKDQAVSLEQAVLLRTQELRRANNSLQEEVIERVRAEDRVRGVAAELRRSNEELEKFAYVASHDLQEPLRKILAFGDRLNRKSRDRLDEQSQGYLERMLSSADRMRTLIDDLLAFSRVATDMRPFVKVNLDTVLADVVADLETSLAQSQGRIEAATLPIVAADPLQMRQLFQNLVGNALKFAKPGEPPVVELAAIRLENLPPTADPPVPAFPGWRLTCADRGIGFDQIHDRRIFEVFQRLHGRDQYEGTGIGLAICRKIVERHGGAIHARGQLGVGTTFIVDLPDEPPATFVVPS